MPPNDGVMSISDYLPFMLLHRYGPMLDKDFRQSVYDSLLGGSDSYGNPKAGGFSFNLADFTNDYLNEVGDKYDPSDDKEADAYNWISNQINTVSNNLANNSSYADEAARINAYASERPDEFEAPEQKAKLQFVRSFLQGVQRNQNQIHEANTNPQRYYQLAAALAQQGGDPTPILQLTAKMHQAAQARSRHEALLGRIADMRLRARNGVGYGGTTVYTNYLRAKAGSDRHRRWLMERYSNVGDGTFGG